MSKSNFSFAFQRFLEMVPGLISWNIILFLIWGSFLVPRLVAYFVLAFLIFWFYQSFKTAVLGINGYRKIRQTKKTNWRQKYKTEKKNKKGWLPWEKIKHIVIIPNVNESVEKLSENLDCLVKQKDINLRNLIVVLAMEERASGAHQRAKILLKKYRGKFGKIIATFHPANITGEIIGKASNEAWAAKKIKKLLIDKLREEIKHFTITSCDADTCFHSKYFSALSYCFGKSKHRYLRFWQSPIFWHNNLDQVPAPIRITGIIGGIIHIADLQQPEKLLFNYSSYSSSLKLLNDIGYWDTDIIPEDWHVFLQSFFAKKGKTLTEPIFLPTSIDAPEGKTYFGALKNRYLQCQRHGWGATDIPYAIKQSCLHPEIPFLVKLLRVYKIIETHLLWTTNWFILTLGASLPPLLNPKFFQTSLGYNLPKFSRLILTTCLLSLAVIIFLDAKLRPKYKREIPLWKKIIYLVQWILMPAASLFMSVLPALDAQTKLLVGKRLEYRVTEKY